MKNTSGVKLNKEGVIGIFFLKEIWSYYDGLRNNTKNLEQVEWKYMNAVFNTLGIGLEPTLKFLMSSSASFDDFEVWIKNNGTVSEKMISHFNSIILKDSSENFTSEEKIFNKSDIEQWNKKGFIVLKNAISKEDCQLSVDFICNKIDVDMHNKETWYQSHSLKQGIMIQLFNSKVLDKNRLSKRIRLAFEQLWNTNRLLVSMDRVSFNPPETDYYKFPGPNLHWDVSLKQPIPFGIQGLLYLTDTKEDQGAFTLIPGFHNKIELWLTQLDSDMNPRELNLLDHFKEKPISGNVGDLIIWNHCLPHGSRPNNSTSPRIVQYINYQPIDLEYQNEWI